MNLPNKITITRLCLVPVFFLAYLLPEFFGESLQLLSVILMVVCYVVAELSDLLDGMIARKYNLVTDLGKVMDPFSDTLSHLTFFVCFTLSGIMPAWTLIIIIWREFGMNFMRMLMMGRGKAVAANIFGKAKTVMYAISSIMAIAYIAFSYFMPGGWTHSAQIALYIAFSLSAIASLLSFVIYFKDIIKSKALSGMTR